MASPSTDPTDAVDGAAYADLPVDHDSRAYWDGCLERRLLITRCQDCGYWIHFPRHLCPKCWSEDVVPTEVSGRGTVYTFAVFHEGDARYPAVVVELEEQPRLRIPSTIVDSDDIFIGMPVELIWIDYKGVPVPAFRPAS